MRPLSRLLPRSGSTRSRILPERSVSKMLIWFCLAVFLSEASSTATLSVSPVCTARLVSSAIDWAVASSCRTFSLLA